MKATYEDVYQTQHPNVQEYLKHVQQATLLSAIHVSLAADLSVSELCVTQTVHQNPWRQHQLVSSIKSLHLPLQEAQKDAVSAFDDFMDQVLETDWAKDRAKLVNTIMPIGSAANRQQAVKPASSPAAASSRALMLPAANGKTQITD